MSIQNKIPTEQDAKNILHEVLGKKAKEVYRFPTGVTNYVYGVKIAGGEELVVRLTTAEKQKYFEGAIHWYELLLEKEVPLPKLYYASADSAKYGFPVMIMDRLHGKDLGDVYRVLTTKQKRVLAKKIVAIQNSVASLPEGKGFGYYPSEHKRWIDVLDADLERSRKRMQETGIADTSDIDRVKEAIHKYTSYFEKITPACFLDDITTRNVIVDETGNLAGIIDVDAPSFGDPLLTPALTKIALMGNGYDTEYADFWIENLRLSQEQMKAVNLYMALFCVNFIAEMGQVFNREKANPVDVEKHTYLRGILQNLLN